MFAFRVPPRMAGAVTVALAVAPTSDDAMLSAALALEVGVKASVLKVTQQNVEADELAATSIIEAWNASECSATDQAMLLGAASDGTLAALPRFHQDSFGSALLPGKLEEEAVAFARRLLETAQSSHPNDEVLPVVCAEMAASLRVCSRADALETLASLGESSLGAVARAFDKQVEGSVTLQQRVASLVGGSRSGTLRVILDARIERTASLSSASRDSGSSFSAPTAVMQARRLFSAGKGLFCGTDEDAFIEIIGFASPQHAAALRYEYAMRHGHTLAAAIRDETRGDLQALLLAFLDPPPSARLEEPDLDLAEAQAQRLWRASEGAGYDGAEWARVFGEVSAPQVRIRCVNPSSQMSLLMNPPCSTRAANDSSLP